MTSQPRLTRENVLDDRWLFMLGARYFNVQTKLRAGEYRFPKAASVRQVLDTLVEGKAILHKVTIVEGRTTYEAVEALMSEPLLTGEIMKLPPEGSPPAGHLPLLARHDAAGSDRSHDRGDGPLS